MSVERNEARGRVLARNLAATVLLCACADPAGLHAQGLAPVGPDQLGFSVANMDASVSPAVDFYRYAAGGWLNRVERPERYASYGFLEIMTDRVQTQMRSVMAEAARDAATAPKGSPTQQVGTLYNNAAGNMRNWWQTADETAFDSRAAGLIDQANRYQVMPGVMGNGPLEIGENMADLGGITLAQEALHSYLAAHPEEDVPIDGLSPDQRCFIAWAQLWAWQGEEAALRSEVATDHHPPNAYRTTAPLQHLDAFYSAFGIKPGDPMWLAPEKRVSVW